MYGTVPSGLKLATIGCSVDGVNAAQPPSIVPSPTTALYNQVFCTFPNLSNDREHQLVLTVDGSASTFFLDYILYLYDDSSRQAAVPATSLANILIDDANTDLITYAGPGAAWNTEGGNGEFRQTTHHTVTAGATATFKFSGIEARPMLLLILMYCVLGSSRDRCASFWHHRCKLTDSSTIRCYVQHRRRCTDALYLSRSKHSGPTNPILPVPLDS